MVTDSHRGGAAAVMEDEALLLAVQRPLNRGDELVANEAVLCELGAIFEIDSMDLGVLVGFNGKFIERDDGVVLLTEVEIRDERGGGAENGARHLGSEAKRGVFRILVLMIGWFMRLVDYDKAEFANRGEKGAAWADNELRAFGFKGFLPELMANGLGLFRVKQGDVFKILLEIADELRGESNFWHQQNNRFSFGENRFCKGDINICFARAGDAVKEQRISLVIC